MGPYASDTDHLSSECYGADEDDIMYDVFERYRVEEKNPMGAGTGVWKLPKGSGPAWSADDNNRSGEIYESEGETFMRALLGPNNRFRLAPGALSDMDNAEMIVQNQFSKEKAIVPFAHRYELV